nr:signal peptidase I [uncultured Flavobacterium sp.]
MTPIQWFIFFLAVQVVHFAGTWKLYEKAGRKPWEAAVPVYNAVILMKIINRPWYWTILLFIPIVNLIMFPVVWVQILKSFGKNKTSDYIIGILTAGLYIYALNYSDKADYNANTETTESTLSSLLFAVVVATIVHTYFIQPFQIPSSSLEKTLLIGDFLFVSKVHYGPRVPMTTVAAPMVHDTIPVLGVKSYSKWPQLPYMRIPGFAKPAKNDIVVFNWPADTVKKFFDQNSFGIRKPVDKKSNYVKRCVAAPGDTFSLRDGVVFINGAELKLSDRAKVQYSYTLTTKDKSMLDQRYIIQDLGINPSDYYVDNNGIYRFAALTNEMVSKLKVNPLVESIEKRILKNNDGMDIDKRYYIFPYNHADWTVDNIGDIYVPEKGKQVTLTTENLPFYKKVIEEYEHNELKVTGNEIRINGAPATSYTFQQDYYFMMGDNRHNSEDSRFWGFVPEDHVVGKPVFIWMSWDGVNKKIRWERMFTTVGGNGEPVSYFRYFIIALAGYLALDFFVLKKKKEQKG